jgi:transposase
MESTELYQQILGLQEPWFVQAVALDANAATVRIQLAHRIGKGVFQCPRCQQSAPIYDHLEARTWRHLDTCQFETLLQAQVPRVDCRRCGVHTVGVPWAEPGGRFTLLFESFAIDVLLTAQVQSRAARLLRLSAEQVASLLARAVARGLERRSQTRAVRHVQLDEKSLHRGHDYVSILSDGTQGAVLEVVAERTTQATESLFEQALSPRQRARIEVVTLDMWEPFAQAARAQVPQAAQVYDRFHLSQHLNAAVDQTRRAENKRLQAQQDKSLNRTRYLWLRDPATLDEGQQAQLAELSERDLQTVAVWRLKEEFRAFFACRTVEEAREFFQSWQQRVKELGNAALQKVAAMFDRHWSGLAAYIEHRVTNALAESLNTQIQLLKAKARGFRYASGFRRAILFHLGQLDLYPHELR